MDPSSRSTAAATAVILVLVGLAIVVLLTVGGGGGGPASDPSEAGPSGTSTGAVPSTTAPPANPTNPTDPSAPATTPSGSPTIRQDGTVCVPQVTEKTITVMTFNIKSGRVTGRVDIGKVGDQIAVYQPDIVMMQEVEKGRPVSNYIDEPAVLADQLKMQWTFGGNDRRSATNQLGNATLSRFPILDSVNTQLPARPGKHRRGLLATTIDLGGIEVEVFNTHLEHTSGADRERQIAVVAGIVGASKAPKFLGGDFNSGPVGPVLGRARTVVRDSWTEVGSGAGLTAPSGRPRVRIDYLLYSGGGDVAVTPLRMEVLPTNASDHRAVMASYRITKDEGEICLPVVAED
ncbi:endonuclease/exonuclease/phosphatase family protein [Nocardioides sp.]|uniref:endonuclease/exonuclease/phosphatase family protein n=1 Tax=Nocardioides sp. TaxID=35761 RepID=UPI002715E161|nr:endonuclease/exonuclease/phosphatase family protein [Nocardioides sp.]MDO9457047.1 endonuclease/exonuclease/phosphatase family protein [Nocardioides sp.]